MLEEAASIVVILRLWRVFKIVEEFSAGASDREYNFNVSPLECTSKASLEAFREQRTVFTPLALPHLLEELSDSTICAEMEVLGEKMEKLEEENQELRRKLKAIQNDENGQ